MGRKLASEEARELLRDLAETQRLAAIVRGHLCSRARREALEQDVAQPTGAVPPLGRAGGRGSPGQR